MNAPVVLFVYNRVEHTQETFNALKAVHHACDIDLFIYSDGCKDDYRDKQKVDQVRSYLGQIKDKHPFRSLHIVERQHNVGLAKSVISGVTEVINIAHRVIVLEDDIVVSAGFYDTMNKLLEVYQENPKVSSISGYMYPVTIPDSCDDYFLLRRASSWGWATWSDRWEQTDWHVEDYDFFIGNKGLQKKFNEGGEDLTPMLIKWKKGMNDSWAIRWCYYHFKTDTYGVFPKHSMVLNIGHDGTGTHTRNSNRYHQKLELNPAVELPSMLSENHVVKENIQQFFRLSLIRRQINKFIL